MRAVSAPARVSKRRAGCNVAGLTVQIFRTWEALSDLRLHWNEVQASSENSSLSLAWEWLSSHKASYGDRQLLVLVCYRDQGEVIGIAPLYKSQRALSGKFAISVLRILGDDTGDCGNLGLIAQRGCEPQVANAFLAWLEGSKEWDAVEFNCLGPDSGALDGVLRVRNWTFSRRESPHLILQLPSSWESFLDSLSKKHRSALSAKLRSLDQRDMQFRRCETEAEASKAIDHLVHLHTARWQEQWIEGAFANPMRAEFYKELARQLISRNMLDCWVLEMNGGVVAVEFGCIHGSTRMAMQSGFDPVYRKHGIGAALEAKVIQASIEAGLKSYDFLGGEHWFKKRWGAKREPYVSIRCSKGRMVGWLWIQSGKYFGTSAAGLRRFMRGTS